MEQLTDASRQVSATAQQIAARRRQPRRPGRQPRDAPAADAEPVTAAVIARCSPSLLPVGRDLYAMPIEWVRQVVAAPTAHRIGDRARTSCSACSTCAGEIVPLLDTAALLGIGRIEPTTVVVGGPDSRTGPLRSP